LTVREIKVIKVPLMIGEENRILLKVSLQMLFVSSEDQHVLYRTKESKMAVAVL